MRAVREVFFADMEDVAVKSMLTPPRIIGSGLKPGSETPARRERLFNRA